MLVAAANQTTTPEAQLSSQPLDVVLPADSKGVKSTDLFEARRILSENKATIDQVLATPSKSLGLVPVLHAIAIGQPLLATAIASAKATGTTGKSFSAQSGLGETALNVALRFEQLPVARFLMHDPVRRAAITDTSLWVTTDSVRESLQAPESPETIAAKLTGSPAKEFWCTDDLLIYMPHCKSMTDTPFKHKVEGFNVQTVLTLRSRALVAFYQSVEDTSLRESVVTELTTTLEALRQGRRFTSIALTKDESVRNEAFALEVDATIQRMRTLFDSPAPRPYMMPLTTEKHAVYLDVAAVGDKLVVHIDNRGESDNSHVEVGPDVYPYVFELPRTPEGYEQLRDLFREMYTMAATKSIVDVYDLVKTRIATFMETNPATLHDPRKSREWLALKQLAGNCTYANITPGMQRRMGIETVIQFRNFELKHTMAAIRESVSEARQLEAIAEHEKNLEKTLFSSQARDTL